MRSYSSTPDNVNSRKCNWFKYYLQYILTTTHIFDILIHIVARATNTRALTSFAHERKTRYWNGNTALFLRTRLQICDTSSSREAPRKSEHSTVPADSRGSLMYRTGLATIWKNVVKTVFGHIKYLYKLFNFINLCIKCSHDNY